MAKTLIIAEKPSVARDIVSALPGSFDEHKNFYESDDYVVTFAVGHLLELSDPEDYDPAWKSEWIGEYNAPTTGPLTTGRDPASGS